MCYPKPGPRCSAHAATRLLKASEALKGKSSFTNYEIYETLKAKEAEAQADYDATPAGFKQLERRIHNGEGIKDEYKTRLDLGKARRKEQLSAIKAKDSGDITHNPTTKELTETKKGLAEFAKLPTSFLSDNAPRIGIDRKSAEVEGIVAESDTWLKTLTPEEQEAIAWYTSNGAGTINAYLLSVEPDAFKNTYSEEYIQRGIKNLDTALAKYESKQSKVVYRGLQGHVFSDTTEDLYNEATLKTYIESRYKIGEIYQNEAHMSASYDPRKGLGFSSHSVVMEIKTKKAAPVTNTSAWGISEKEALVPRNLKLKIIGIKYDLDYGINSHTKEQEQVTVIQLEEL